MEKPNKFCQSCGMPMNKDEKGGGTNADGSKTLLYCSYCFQNGEFTRPDMSLQEMKTLVKGKMKEMGFPGFVASIFTFKMGKLQRWKESN
jgi:hypothetical protein